MDFNSIFDIYGNRMPINHVHVVNGNIIDMTFALTTLKDLGFAYMYDDFGLIKKGIACDWSIVMEKGWGHAVVERDRIYFDLNKEKINVIEIQYTEQEERDWAAFRRPGILDPVRDFCLIHKDQTVEFVHNEHGKILSRIVKAKSGELLYFEHNQYSYYNGKSYRTVSRNSFFGCDYDQKTKKTTYVYGEPKSEYNARSTKRAYK